MMETRGEHGSLARTYLSTGAEGYAVLSFPAPRAALARELSDSERQVLELALAGLDNAAIAARRGTALRTVANQLASIYRKLGVARHELLSMMVARALDEEAQAESPDQERVPKCSKT